MATAEWLSVKAARDISCKSEGQSMSIATHVSRFRQVVQNACSSRRGSSVAPALGVSLCLALFGLAGCGQTAKVVTSPAVRQVDSYFGSPFFVSGSAVVRSTSAFDHANDQVTVSALLSTQTAQVPTVIMAGTFSPAASGFMSITENFATAGSGTLVAENPPVTGAWAVEIPGAGALANLLSLQSSGATTAAPAAMAENAECPNFSSAIPFLYVTAPKTTLAGDTADYGQVKLSTEGSYVTFSATPFLIGPVAGTASTVTGGCSDTNFGALAAYPVNSFGSASNLDLIGIGASGLLVSNFSTGGSGAGAFGGGSGVIGVAEPSTPVDVSATAGAKYNGFIYDPLNRVQQNYDITTLASSFGDDTATSTACSALQSALQANHGAGIKSVPVLPSPNAIYGGEFLTGSAASAVNDPTGASGSENCDTAIDLGTQDSTIHGLFPNATVYIGSNFPPFSANSPWICPETGSVCAVSFPAAAVVGQVQGQYVIFLVSSAVSTPAAQLPDASGIRQVQPVGIYLFQRLK
jgi:hypothetical protein